MTQGWLLIVAMMLLASVAVLWAAWRNKSIDLAYWKGYAETKNILAGKYIEILVANGLGDKALRAINEVQNKSEKDAPEAEPRRTLDRWCFHCSESFSSQDPGCNPSLSRQVCARCITAINRWLDWEEHRPEREKRAREFEDLIIRLATETLKKGPTRAKHEQEGTDKV